MTDNNTNLPILDDIIKPGDTDKAVHQPSSKVQSSLWSDQERSDAQTAATDDETWANPAADDRPDTIELFTDDQPAVDLTDRNEDPTATETDAGLAIGEGVQDEAPEEAELARASAIDLPDIDALTDEILDNLILQIEPLLRDRIQQTLSRHLSGKNKPD